MDTTERLDKKHRSGGLVLCQPGNLGTETQRGSRPGEQPATGLEGRECGARSPGAPGVPAAMGGGRGTLRWSFWGKQDPPDLDFRLRSAELGDDVRPLC